MKPFCKLVHTNKKQNSIPAPPQANYTRIPQGGTVERRARVKNAFFSCFSVGQSPLRGEIKST
jgi:hypothetical protein